MMSNNSEFRNATGFYHEQPQQNALLQQYFDAFGPHSQYAANVGANFTGVNTSDAAAPFLPFLPHHPHQMPPTTSSTVPAHSYYYSPNLTLTDRPVATVSPVDLKYRLDGSNASNNSNRSEVVDTRQTNSANISPFDFKPSVGNQQQQFYNQFFQDNYFSAMGTAVDSYPSTSFMGVSNYTPHCYSYGSSTVTTSASNAMDLVQQSQQQTNPLLVNSWKYPASSEKPAKQKIRSLSPLSRAPNPPHKIGPGTNNVRVRTEDKYRTVYTDRQRLELEKEFRLHQFITSDRKAALAGQLKLTERQVKIWFQNRRAKNRKQEVPHRSLRVAMSR